MLLLFLFSQIVVASANPFHKYPYVFLLDVGNEEIEKVNTEQIRISIPGGSLAVRYPAVGEGDTIEHVRISGIDFGTDLKASIVQGGPGYKYVVFVFMGNPGIAYDAVVTIQTVPKMNLPNDYIKSYSIENQVLGDVNDSAEDLSDNTETKTVYGGNTKSQVMQSSSNVYQYSVSENVDDDDFKNEAETQDDEKSDDTNEDAVEKENDDSDDDSQSDNDYAKGDSSISPDDNGSLNNVNSNQYGKYEAFKPHWYGGVRFYPQAALYTQNEYSKIYDAENQNQDENDEANVIIRENNYKDNNNNNEDIDDGPPVEY